MMESRRRSTRLHGGTINSKVERTTSTTTTTVKTHHFSQGQKYQYVEDPWEKSPKTDYTYAKSGSYHVEALTNPYISPNMSRRSLRRSGDMTSSTEGTSSVFDGSYMSIALEKEAMQREGTRYEYDEDPEEIILTQKLSASATRQGTVYGTPMVLSTKSHKKAASSKAKAAGSKARNARRTSVMSSRYEKQLEYAGESSPIKEQSIDHLYETEVMENQEEMDDQAAEGQESAITSMVTGITTIMYSTLSLISTIFTYLWVKTKSLGVTAYSFVSETAKTVTSSTTTMSTSTTTSSTEHTSQTQSSAARPSAGMWSLLKGMAMAVLNSCWWLLSSVASVAGSTVKSASSFGQTVITALTERSASAHTAVTGAFWRREQVQGSSTPGDTYSSGSLWGRLKGMGAAILNSCWWLLSSVATAAGSAVRSVTSFGHTIITVVTEKSSASFSAVTGAFWGREQVQDGSALAGRETTGGLWCKLKGMGVAVLKSCLWLFSSVTSVAGSAVRSVTSFGQTVLKVLTDGSTKTFTAVTGAFWGREQVQGGSALAGNGTAGFLPSIVSLGAAGGRLYRLISRSVVLDTWLLYRVHEARRRSICCCLLPLILLLPILLFPGSHYLYQATQSAAAGGLLGLSSSAVEEKPVVPAAVPPVILVNNQSEVLPQQLQQLWLLLQQQQEQLQLKTSCPTPLTREQVEAIIRGIMTSEVSALRRDVETEATRDREMQNEQYVRLGTQISTVEQQLKILNAKADDLSAELVKAKETMSSAGAAAESQQASSEAVLALEKKLGLVQDSLKGLEDTQALLVSQLKQCCHNDTALVGLIKNTMEDNLPDMMVGAAMGGAGAAGNDSEANRDSLFAFLKEHFVTRSEADAKLAGLMSQLDDRMREQILVMAASAARQAIANQSQAVHNDPQSHTVETPSVADIEGAVSEKDVQEMITNALNKYSADKTGMVDFALESAGGSVVNTRCSESYDRSTGSLSVFGLPLWWVSNSPRTAIQPDMQPGQCWAFKGSEGYLVIQLSGQVQPSAFSIEHIPATMSATGKIDSAPKDFSVWGLPNEKATTGENLGTFMYDTEGEQLQLFPVQVENPGVFEFVELKIHSNHGHPDYTCLYRFRVHGELKSL